MKTIFKTICVMGVLSTLSHVSKAESDIDLIRQRMADSYIVVEQNDPQVLARIHFINTYADRTDAVVRELPEGANDSLTAVYTRSLTEAGTWPDIDYASQQRGAWPPAMHVERISAIARSYKDPGSGFYHKPGVSVMLHRALNKWFDMGLVCPNWWYNEIGGPRFLAPALLLLDEELSAEERTKAIRYMAQSKIGMTGQNRTWLAGNVLVRGLLERDAALVREARDAIMSEVRVAPEGEEGIQPDGSFHQHGPQQQFGNYGLAYILGITWWGKIFHGTHFALTSGQVEVLRGYVDATAKVIWKGVMDVNSCGRQLFPYVPEGKALAFGKVLIDMQKLDPERALHYRNLYNQVIKGQEVARPNTGFTHFNYSDMSLQRRPEWFASLKMTSPRVIGTEVINSENLLSYLMADGALMLYKNGREFENIFAVWDYTGIPGVTTNIPSDTCRVMQWGGHNDTRGHSPVVGGLALSSGEEGVSVMVVEKNGMTARKAWFFGKDYIVCRGSGISSPHTEGREVRTTVAQQLSAGPVTVIMENDARETLNAGEYIGEWHGGAQAEWVIHDGTAYWFPKGGDLEVRNMPQSGNWKRFATMFPDTTVTQDIFSVTIRHGYEPKAEGYDYVIVPDADNLDLNGWYRNAPFKLIDTPDPAKATAVEWTADGRRDMVFFEAGSLTFGDGTTVETSVPAIISLSGNGEVAICAPDWSEQAATVWIKDSNTIYQRGFSPAEEKGKTIYRKQ